MSLGFLAGAVVGVESQRDREQAAEGVAVRSWVAASERASSGAVSGVVVGGSAGAAAAGVAVVRWCRRGWSGGRGDGGSRDCSFRRFVDGEAAAVVVSGSAANSAMVDGTLGSGLCGGVVAAADRDPSPTNKCWHPGRAILAHSGDDVGAPLRVLDDRSGCRGPAPGRSERLTAGWWQGSTLSSELARRRIDGPCFRYRHGRAPSQVRGVMPSRRGVDHPQARRSVGAY